MQAGADITNLYSDYVKTLETYLHVQDKAGNVKVNTGT